MNISSLREKHNIKLIIAMKLKSKVKVAFIFIFLFFGTIGISTIQAQGVFSAKTGETVVESTENTENTQSEDSGSGLFRAGDWSGGSYDREPDPKGRDLPVGEGILILSILSGAYAIVKRNVKRKNEI